MRSNNFNTKIVGKLGSVPCTASDLAKKQEQLESFCRNRTVTSEMTQALIKHNLQLSKIVIDTVCKKLNVKSTQSMPIAFSEIGKALTAFNKTI